MAYPSDLQSFISQSKELIDSSPLQVKDYILLCRTGIVLAKRYPKAREIIATELVSVGASLDDRIDANLTLIKSYKRAREIADYAMGLEWSGNHSDVDQAWENFRLMVVSSYADTK